MTRKEVLELCYAAHSRPAIRDAIAARSQYLAEHPGDEALLDIGAMLSRHLQALDDMGVDGGEPAPFPAVPEPQTAGTG
jgi:hypothetical protein